MVEKPVFVLLRAKVTVPAKLLAEPEPGLKGLLVPIHRLIGALALLAVKVVEPPTEMAA